MFYYQQACAQAAMPVLRLLEWVFRPAGATYFLDKRDRRSAPLCQISRLSDRNVGIQSQNYQNVDFSP